MGDFRFAPRNVEEAKAGRGVMVSVIEKAWLRGSTVRCGMGVR